MEKIISNAEIQQTKTYQKLDLGFQILVLKLPSKKAITAGLLIHKTTGVIPGSIGGNNLKILKELIENEKKTDK